MENAGPAKPQSSPERRTEEKVNHPSHYGGDVKFEAIKLIVDWGLGFCVGNALKYIIRAPYKGTFREDLAKAEWYLDYAIKVDEPRYTGDAPIQLVQWVIRSVAVVLRMFGRKWDHTPWKRRKLSALDAADYWFGVNRQQRLEAGLGREQWLHLEEAMIALGRFDLRWARYQVTIANGGIRDGAVEAGIK